MLFAEVVATSSTVAATSSRTAKRDAIAALLQRLEPDEVPVVVGFLVGAPRQGRIGVGWRTFDAAASTVGSAELASVQVAEVDALLSELAVTSGPGSAAVRRRLLVDLLGRSTRDEVSFLARLVGGELRQGSLQGVMTDAIAAASGAPLAVVRRGVMLGGDLPTVAATAMWGGRAALEGIGLELGRPLQPMLASTSASVTEAVEAIGSSSVEWKLDGIRIQVHRHDDEVRIWSRNLNELTDRLPDVVDVVRALPLQSAVLDGEAIGIDLSGRPVLFQDTVSRRGADASFRGAGPAGGAAVGDATVGDAPDGARHGLRPYFFDLVHLDGVDLIDEPLVERRAALHRVAATWAIPSELTSDPAQAEQVLADALDAGHEGVVVKSSGSAYEAGRRGKAWRKVKPVHTLDLVVLGAEWGHGRRRGWLSNLHLGARTADGGFVMVGKTFKGLTDELLAWQTDRFLALAGLERPTGEAPVGTVELPPVQVVEIAVDGVQRSTRYPGGVALRFARVVRYRSDKDASQADRIETVQALLGRSGAAGD